jgi:hypothetical protein
MIFDKLKNVLNANSKKPHLLIAGVDLKFITPSIRYLEKYYEIKPQFNNRPLLPSLARGYAPRRVEQYQESAHDSAEIR